MRTARFLLFLFAALRPGAERVGAGAELEDLAFEQLCALAAGREGLVGAAHAAAAGGGEGDDITVNKNAIPNDPQKPGVTSGVRIGTPACTTRGFTEEDMPVVADCIDKIATDYDANREAVLAAVAALVKKHPIYE